MKQPWYKYSVNYAWMGTRKGTVTHDLLTPKGRQVYYEDNVEEELKLLRNFFKNNTFVGYLLAPKNAGKGTYIKGLAEALGGDYFDHVSVGDVVRSAEIEYKENGKESELYKYAQKNYRGYMHLDEVFEALTNRSTTSLVPTEFVLMLIKRILEKKEKRTVFIDGFPRNLDQVSYSLYFRELINFREDPDVFIMINAPVTVLDERIKQRVICPNCQTPRNLTLFPTKEVGYDSEKKLFFLVCDNADCSNPQRMVAKEGDEFGLEPIKDRIMMDVKLMERARSLYGVPKIELYNALEADKALEYVNDCEITKEFVYTVNEDSTVNKEARFWEVEEGEERYRSLLPQPVIVQFIKQLVANFNLKERV